jgi:hypothetical protein
MATFVHLTPEPLAERIRRNGITRLRKPRPGFPGGIFAVPVTRNFYVSHQWLRELKRGGQRTIVAVYFRIDDDTTVWVGHYNSPARPMTAAAAVAEFMSRESHEGWQVVIPERIAPKEITRIRTLPQVIGWRYAPDAKGTLPCPCDYCLAGDVKASRLRARGEEIWRKKEAAAKTSPPPSGDRET